MAEPYLPFFTRDWRSDPLLRSCSLEARGLWIEMMCLMHEAGGQLIVGERRLTEADFAAIASQLGVAPPSVKRGMAELKRNGVYSVTEDGVIYSRRMVRDTLRRHVNRENGKKGGNPGLKATSPVNRPSVNPSDNPHSGKGSDKANARAPLGWVGYDLSPTQSLALAEMQPALALGVWFVWAGVKAGAIQGHHEPFAERTARYALEISEALLGTHELTEIQRRAARMFALATTRGRDRWRVVTLQMLADRWDTFAPDGNASQVAAEDPVAAQLRAVGVRG